MDTMSLYYFTTVEDFPFFIQYGYHDEDMFIHTHTDYAELVIVLNGSAKHHVDDELYNIKKGDVFVINENTAHGYSNTSDFYICNIMYSPSDFLPLSLDIRMSAGFHALFIIDPYIAKTYRFMSRLTLEASEFDRITNTIELLYSEFICKEEGWKTATLAHFNSLVVALSRKHSLTASEFTANIINIAKSVSYMDKYYNEPLSLKSIAEKSNMSVRHFSRCFKLVYQTTPWKYLLSLRLNRACHLLTSTSRSVSEIAYQSGFSDGNYMSRQFRLQLGITPCDYRRDLRKPHQ